MTARSRVFVLMGIVVSLWFVSASWAQERKPFVVLPASQALAVNQLCSRPGPKVEGGWVPEERDTQALEARLGDVTSERHGTISNPFSFYRQYVGIVVAGKRLIYVNAFPPQVGLKDWKTRLMSVCDGGPSFWGIQFDPTDDKFFDLEMNGRA
jgi:hypothetical protein